MPLNSSHSVAISLVLVLLTRGIHAGVPEDALQILKRHCHQCHAAPANESGFGYINQPQRLIEKRQIIPGNTNASPLYQRIVSGAMPPEGERLTPNEINTIAEWIRINAPDSSKTARQIPSREPITLKSEFRAIQKHLHSQEPEDRIYWRFFSLRNMHNSPKRTLKEIDYCRAALGKALNSVSWRAKIVTPLKIDDTATLYGIDIRDMQWSPDFWQRILSYYPYGLKHHSLPDDRELNELSSDTYTAIDTDVPVIRADWFVARAMRPPLYHELLQIPEHENALEKRLGVNAKENILQGQVVRKAMSNSGISEQHRLIERHEASHGYYWKSYDFKPTAQQGDLATFPLGPMFGANPYNKYAFTHDGGEFIFRLPNGLQGYMLVNGSGNRIDAGPSDVVSDRRRVSGNVEIINGLSCMSCHSQGLIQGEQDIARDGSPLQGNALNYLRRIYPGTQKVDALIRDDSTQFREAVYKAMQGIALDSQQLRINETLVVEPITDLAKGYALDMLDIDDLAIELGLADSSKLRAAIEFDDRLARVGLRPLLNGQSKIKRALWENNDSSQSPYQLTASFLKLGTPKVVLQLGR